MRGILMSKMAVGRGAAEPFKGGDAVGAGVDLVAFGFQQHAQRSQNVLVVVNQCDGRHLANASTASSS